MAYYHTCLVVPGIRSTAIRRRVKGRVQFTARTMSLQDPINRPQTKLRRCWSRRVWLMGIALYISDLWKGKGVVALAVCVLPSGSWLLGRWFFLGRECLLLYPRERKKAGWFSPSMGSRHLPRERVTNCNAYFFWGVQRIEDLDGDSDPSVVWHKTT